MSTPLFISDLEIARKILEHDEAATREFFYIKCYPLFKSVFEHFYTDCDTCVDFIHEMYVVVLAPSRKTGKCQLENFRGESTLTKWLKTACLYYCYKRFKKKINVVSLDCASNKKQEGGSTFAKETSFNTIFSRLERRDVEMIIQKMSNSRYKQIMRLVYLEKYSLKDTADLMGMKIQNFYSKHALAKAQFENELLKDENYGK